MKNIRLVLVVALLSTIIAFSVSYYLNTESKKVILREANTPVVLAKDYSNTINSGVDFTNAAEKTTEAVVHIKSTVRSQGSAVMPPNPFREFFGDNFPSQPRESMASGSGVIISQEGYIVTNNHVVDEASTIEVTLHDNRTYEATLIGTDPSTDLAVIKIEEEGLNSLSFANSDEVKIGSWVLAVGNPFNLASTVTAGIVSAKARNINILRDNYAIESFIQTDAAINRGNSGGALVNLNGDLIGINTAIATPTGTYTGYAFAVPSNIVKKVTEDLIEFGTVQRGFLGIMIRNVNPQLQEDKNLNVSNGVLVDSITANSAAGEAGVKSGDIIIAIDGIEVKTTPELMEKVGRKRPGEKVKVTLLRDDKELNYDVILNNKNGKTEYLAKIEKSEMLSNLGITISDLSENEMEELGIEGGVKVEKVGPGKIRRYTSIAPGFVIKSINNKKIKDRDHFLELLEKQDGGVMLEGTYPKKGGEFYYAFGL